MPWNGETVRLGQQLGLLLLNGMEQLSAETVYYHVAIVVYTVSQ